VGAPLSRDARLLIAGQGVRALGYGFTAVLLGALLAARGYSHLRAGLLLTALIAGTAVSSLVIGAVADRVGRRPCYAAVFALIALAGTLVATEAPYGVLLAIALTGALSTDVVDNGPATTLEQTMLAREDAGTARVYGRYNAVGATAGALGALAQVLPDVDPRNARLFLVLVPVGLVGVALTAAMTREVESPGSAEVAAGPTRASPVVRRLAALFAVDAAGGGLVTTAFLSYLFSERYHASVHALGALFFAVSLVQAASVAVAPRLARRFGLVRTMVGTHLPSNVLLASVAFAPTFPVAVALLLARTTLSQMDVPTRQALVMSVVRPEDRTRAAAVTNAARYTVRPIGPVVAGALQQVALGAPLLVAGTVKAGYDLALWHWARRHDLA
jgi:MFS family permease